MDPEIRRILRVGLIDDPEHRGAYIRALQALPQTEETINAEMALKDPSTTLDDFEDIESGKHAQAYKQNNIKLNEAVEISALDGPQNTSNLKLASNNRELTQELLTGEGIRIDDELELEVDPIRAMAFHRNGEQFFGNIPTNNSQKRIQNAIKVFKERTSKRTQDKILRAILDAADDVIGKEKEFIPTEQYVKIFNEQLDDDERVRVVAEFLKIAQSTIYNKA